MPDTNDPPVDVPVAPVVGAGGGQNVPQEQPEDVELEAVVGKSGGVNLPTGRQVDI